VVEATDPEPVFRFFLETLGFPLAWRLDQYAQTHVSGGVIAGECDIEVAKYLLWPSGRVDPHIQTLDFEPVDIESADAELDARGIGHLPPFSEDAGRTIHDVLGDHASRGWTLIALDSPLGANLYTALVDFGHDATERRALEQQRLVEANGGPLGIIALAEVWIGVRDMQPQRERWSSILAPAREPEPGYFVFPGGPAIRLVEGDDAAAGLVFAVRDVELTTSALTEREIAGAREARWIDVDPARAFGLQLRFAEDDAGPNAI
jgi:hypothetical protein